MCSRTFGVPRAINYVKADWSFIFSRTFGLSRAINYIMADLARTCVPRSSVRLDTELLDARKKAQSPSAFAITKNNLRKTLLVVVLLTSEGLQREF
jgi:hypothetical protein